MGSVAGESKYGGGWKDESKLQPPGVTSMSRTSYHQFFPAGFASTFAFENREAEEKLRSVEERIKRGHDNSLAHLQQVTQRMRDNAKHVPPVDELRKKGEDEAHSAWEKFLVKSHAQVKK